MKINEDIILKELSGSMEIEKSGNSVPELMLQHLCFLVPGMEFVSHVIYFGRTEDLPAYVPGVNSLFICAGGRPTGRWRSTDMPVLWIKAPGESIMAVGNRILDILRKYDAWDQSLDEIIDGEADLMKMVNVTMDLLQNPINISNREMDLVVQSVDEHDKKAWPVQARQDGGLIPAPALAAYSHSMREDKKRKGSYLVRTHDSTACCVNIFQHDQYMGCISLSAFHRPLAPSDGVILEYFAKKVEKFLERRPRHAARQFLTIKNGLKDLLDLMPVDEKQMQKVMEVSRESLGEEYHSGMVMCFVVKPEASESPYPAEYICRLIEQRMTSCVSFAYAPYVVSFCLLPDDSERTQAAFSDLTEWLKSLAMEVGISRTFRNIMEARIYYRQACCAMELGHAVNGEAGIYPFDRWALLYVLQHCSGEFPLEYLFPEGLRQMLETRGGGQGVDYWATLRAYLDNECSVAVTAKELYLHRSTMLQRLGRIRQMVDLTTPENRLLVRICMYCLDNSI